LIQNGIYDSLLHHGVDIKTNCEIAEIEKDVDGTFSIKTHDGNSYHGYNYIISAIGRGPLSQDLGLENTEIKQDDHGFILSNEWEETSQKGVFSLGDINNKILLTPVAIRAGRKFADRVFGNQPDAKMDYHNVPSVIFSHPPAGSIGFSEQEAEHKIAKNQLPGPLKVYETHFQSLYYGMMDPKDRSQTHMKIVCVGKEEKVIGLHLIGDGVDEMLQGFGVAMKMGATKADFDSITAIHPTSSEEIVTMKKPRPKDDYKYLFEK